MKKPKFHSARPSLLLCLTLPFASLLLTACSRQPEPAPVQAAAETAGPESAPSAPAPESAPAATPAEQTAAPPAPKPASAQHKPKKVVKTVHKTDVVAAGPAASVAATPAPPRAPLKVCSDCGVITAITPVKEEGKGTAIGVVAGGLAGLVVGNQIGQGQGKTIAKIAGAAGGALLGNKIEKKIRAETHYEIKVRFDNGAETTVNQDNEPTLAVGAKVRVVDGTVIAR
jgi:outer membrane lipoprotein SlyB